jgi:hypothetical protein
MSVDLSQKPVQEYLQNIAYDHYQDANFECVEIFLSLCQKDFNLKGRLVKGALCRHVGQLEEGLNLMIDLEKTLSTEVNK